jgi:arylsulfatase A
MLVRWPEGLPGGRTVDEMVHFTDWLPTILSMAGVKLPETLKLDGVDVLPLLRGETGQAITRRFWQWNRYTPLASCNAAMRDGDFKLIRPVLDAAMQVPDIQWLWVSMYGPEYFIQNGAFQPPYPERDVPAPPPPELYNLADDPLEQTNVAKTYPGIVESMSAALDTWFAEVEAERKTIPRLV